jgi:hypothetical protein
MHKQHKDLLRTVVTALRHRLAGTWDAAGAPVRGDLDRELERLGFDPDGHITPIDALVQPTELERRAYQAADARIAPFPDGAARRQARAEFVERAAYTWINRLLALRTMEARELIDETLRPNPAYDGASEAIFLLRHNAPARTQGPDGGWQAVLDDACAAFAATLPGLFDPTDPNASLRPTAPALLDCIYILGGRLPATTYAVDAVDAVFRDPDVLGWAYQFYQQEAKDRVYAKLGRGGKIETRSEIAAATQLFTEPYMVKWMLQNSLGRSYHEAYPESELPATWEYYIRGEGRDARGDDSQSPIPQSLNLPIPLSSLTLFDPSMGSGHILREGFDLLFAMYREQHPELDAAAIARRILADHLYGIDIDPRAAQLAALTLLLRAWETVRPHNSQFTIHNSQFVLNLATTPTLSPGSLDRHLDRHPEDAVYRPILVGVFAALEQAHLLGSLLRPEEHLDAAIAAFRKQDGRGGQMGLLGESTAANRLLEELGKQDPAELKRLLLERVGHSFAREAAAGDVGGQLLGREAGEGVHLLQLLGRRYAVVCTNPPYMGNRNLASSLRNYIEVHYNAGKADVYSAICLHAADLCTPNGRIAFITPHNWMFLNGFSDFRIRLSEGLGITAVAHLGTKTFADLSNTNALGFAMYCLQKDGKADDSFVCIRIIHEDDKQTALQAATRLTQTVSEQAPTVYRTLHKVVDKLPGRVLFYWMPPGIARAFLASDSLGRHVHARQGLITGDNDRFLRFWWEVSGNGWFPYAKGGAYRRWFGNQELVVNWQSEGVRIKELATPSGKQKSRPQNIQYYGLEGGTWTGQSSYGFSVRYLPNGSIFDAKGPSFFCASAGKLRGMIALANTKLIQFVFSGIEPTVDYHEGYFMRLPGPVGWAAVEELADIGNTAISAKTNTTSQIFTERSFVESAVDVMSSMLADSFILTAEGAMELLAHKAYGLDANDTAAIFAETGLPTGLQPLLEAFDQLPDARNLLLLPLEVTSYLAAHARIAPAPAELARIKTNLRTLYEAGPGANGDDLDLEELDHQDDEEAGAAGAFIPIPTETFLEELSVKLQIHPISVYWLLEELRGEGVRCKPEEQRLLEDRLSVLVLRLLGHRWPKQIEAGEPVPAWADGDGVIPLTPHTGEPTLADRVRARLRAEEGDLAVQRTEALLQELTGRTLAEWLRRDFFKRHVSQFKKRPIAWHLTSGARGGGRGARKSEPRTSGRGSEPAFECMVYYHRTDTDILARIRTQYVERLLERERGAVVHARRGATPDETAIAVATERIRELEEFAARLRAVEEQGFACPALDELLATEPLDRWSGDGVFPPVDRAALLAQEQAWQVDINDGVRVNVAPLQVVGLLASDVLAAKELPKAIADRARWRADERRWVRAGKLPRCGWMAEDVPESPAWTDRAPAREWERARLEEKRKKVMEELNAP